MQIHKVDVKMGGGGEEKKRKEEKEPTTNPIGL